MAADPIRLEVFKHLFAAVAEEMGVVLRKASYSPNIKERRDFSCALFDPAGNMIAQAAHIPVHLGAMPMSVQAAIKKFQTRQTANNFGSQEMHPKTDQLGLFPGDVIVLNDPFLGGTHLPDITMVSPVFTPDPLSPIPSSSREEGIGDRVLIGFVASRAHHADVGGMTPGSMPVAREIFQEGLIIPPVKLFEQGKLNQAVFDLILSNVRTPQERAGDLWAQIAANQRGETRLQELAARYGLSEISAYMGELLSYTERMTRRLLASLPSGAFSFTDYLDDDGMGSGPAVITVTVAFSGDEATVDFTGSAPQQTGSVNAVYAITLSAVYYVFRCLIGLDIPNNSGCLVPIRVIAPEGTIVNAHKPAAVAGGNVETSQRIVDVLLGALAQACPERVPAASQGTMNNLTIGGRNERRDAPFAYYETVGGGMGALPEAGGPSAIHSHMTNTLNTPVEALEYAYPLRILRYAVRRGSGGKGLHHGGDGIRRDIQALVPCQATLLTERRRFQPYGLASGQPGQCGENALIREGIETTLPGKGTVDLQAGDILSIRTPGGGGWGKV